MLGALASVTLTPSLDLWQSRSELGEMRPGPSAPDGKLRAGLGGCSMRSPAGNDGVGRWNELHEGTGATFVSRSPTRKRSTAEKSYIVGAGAVFKLRMLSQGSGDGRTSQEALPLISSQSPSAGSCIFWRASRA